MLMAAMEVTVFADEFNLLKENSDIINVVQIQSGALNEEEFGRSVAQKIVFPSNIIQKGIYENIVLSEEELSDVIEKIPRDIDDTRLSVILKAYSLQGKVSYFWGGKSSTIGWDERWGDLLYVTSEGSRSTGTLRPFGMDCSGYVNWVFNNAAENVVAAEVGNGTADQWEKSTAADWSDAQPGDLAFFHDPDYLQGINHVGIVMGWNQEGQLLVAHCSSSKNTVVITEAVSTGFRYIRTPNIYNDKDYTASMAEDPSLHEYNLRLDTEETADEKLYLATSYYEK